MYATASGRCASRASNRNRLPLRAGAFDPGEQVAASEQQDVAGAANAVGVNRARAIGIRVLVQRAVDPQRMVAVDRQAVHSRARRDELHEIAREAALDLGHHDPAWVDEPELATRRERVVVDGRRAEAVRQQWPEAELRARHVEPYVGPEREAGAADDGERPRHALDLHR